MPDREDQPEGEGMELVLPFVLVASVGGPYDDDAFAAGWQCGDIDRTLAQVPDTVDRLHWPVFRTALHRQVDLIAMRYGFDTVVVVPSQEWPEWGTLTIARESHG